MNDYNSLEPVEVFKWFNEVSIIPRCSGNEREISNFLVKFAKERDLEYFQDEEYNVIIKKSATVGYENCPTVIIQGHMDMVCEKTADSNHNFSCDPIIWRVEGDILKATNTTLGGDDGIAIAYALAILDSDNIDHPNLEVLITTNEETGMDGANAVHGDKLEGTILLNIDGEDEGIFLASCSGGANSYVQFEKETEDIKDKVGIKIDISGLLGGHSGMEIHKQRANAIKLMGRVLYRLSLELDFQIAELEGGSQHNAIANNASVIIGISEKDISKTKEIIADFIKIINEEYKFSDPNIKIELKSTGNISRSYSESLTKRLIDFMSLIINGVRDMDLNIHGLVQSSSNVGVIINGEENITFMSCVRSSVDSILNNELEEIEILSKLVGGKSWVEKQYPAWEFAKESKIRNLAEMTYEDQYGKKAEISAAHCGLETGIIKSIKPELDILSYGPDLMDVHSSNENLSISSVARVWEFTKLLLKNMKKY